MSIGFSEPDLSPFDGVEVSAAVAFEQLFIRIAPGLVHKPSPFGSRSLRHRLGPALNMLVAVHVQKLSGFVKQAFRQPPVPGPGCDISNCVVTARKLGLFPQTLVQQVEVPFYLHGEPVNGIFHFAGRVGVKVAKAPP